MKKILLTVFLTLALCVTTMFVYQNKVYAGDREWATVGKILTGVIGARVLYDVCDDGHYYRTERRVYIERPAYYRNHDVIVVEKYYPSRYYRPVYPRYRRHCPRY